MKKTNFGLVGTVYGYENGFMVMGTITDYDLGFFVLDIGCLDSFI